jgi:hypothetical protein
MKQPKPTFDFLGWTAFDCFIYTGRKPEFEIFSLKEMMNIEKKMTFIRMREKSTSL